MNEFKTMTVIEELQEILRLLDRFVGHYPIYLYLVDSHNTLVWFNQYMSEQLPEFHIGQKLECCTSLWRCEDICPECRSDDTKLPTQIERHLIKRHSSRSGEDVFLEFITLPIYRSENHIEGVLRLGIDVTQNEMLQEQLRKKEKLFSAIINTSTDAVIFLDEQNIIRSWNKGAEDIFGYTAEEIIGKSALQLIPNELIEIGEPVYFRKELTSKGFIKKYETQRLHKDGHPIYVDISSTSIYDEAGNFVGTSEIIKDIDERKELEFELLRTILELSKLNELNDILHSTYDEQEILRIILIAITAGEGLRFNRAFVVLLDKNEEILKGDLAIGPSDQQEANRIWNELNKDYHYLSDIVKIYQIDLEGTDRKVNEIVKKISVPLSEKNHIFVQSLNRKRVFKVKNGVLPDAESLDLKIGDSDLITLLDNDSFVIAPLFTKKESLGLIIADNCINRREITPEDVEGLKLFANQASSAIENSRLYSDLENRLQDLQEAYQQLEENQEKLLRAERLAAIGEMSAKVAHEIRNPLVSIGGFSRLIERKITENSKLKQYAGIISEQVSNLENILNNILATANPPKPQQTLVNLTQLIEQVITILKNAIERRGIKLSVNLPKTELFLKGDQKLLHQAILNLVKNAIEALDEMQGEKEISIRLDQANHHANIQISDNGPGIPENLVNKIFQTFFTTKSSGTGLGLSIVHQIVEAHKGTISVKSTPGEGTIFYLQFPLVNNTETA